MQARGFAAVASPDARVLILGSMPGQPSLAANEYYANPRNAFWPIMAAILDFDPVAPYPLRLAMLRKNRIALWDVVGSCYREGSLDSAIESGSVEVNAFAGFLGKHRQIRTVLFNGGKAEQLWRRFVAPDLGDVNSSLSFRKLPSTSPAYAAMPYDEKLARWLQIKKMI